MEPTTTQGVDQLGAPLGPEIPPPPVATCGRLVEAGLRWGLPLLGVYFLTNFGYFTGNRNKQREKRFGDLLAQLQATGLHPNMIPGSPPEAQVLVRRYYEDSQNTIELTEHQLRILGDMEILKNPKGIGPKAQDRALGKRFQRNRGANN